MNQIEKKIADIADVVEHDPRSRGVLSTSERIAVALVLRRMDWLQADGYDTIDAAFDRLGPEWSVAVGVVIKARNRARLTIVPQDT